MMMTLYSYLSFHNVIYIVIGCKIIVLQSTRTRRRGLGLLVTERVLTLKHNNQMSEVKL